MRVCTLCCRQQFAEKRTQIEEDLVRQAEAKKREADAAELKNLEAKRAKKKKKKAAAAAKLSFADEEADEGDGATEPITKFGKFGKNPTVKTDFLPDRDREIEDAKEAIRMKAEYKEAIKAKMEAEFTIHFLYWQPRGLMMQDVKKNKHTLTVKYGDTVGGLLQKFRDEFHTTYNELRNIAGEQCLFAKEGLMIPHHFTWFELMQRGCTIFGKNVFADLDQMPAEWELGEKGAGTEEDDAAAEQRRKEWKKKELSDSLKLYSHMTVGGILDRRWFDRNRKDFPMVKWEVYNPRKDYRVHFVGDPGPSVVNTEHVS